MRQNGLTAFEAELVNYVLTNEISEGTTFHGVPGHPRYGASKEEELVVVFNSETLSVERVGKKVITINFADYTQGRKRANTTTTTTSNNTNNNNNNNNNNMEDQNTATATANNNNGLSCAQPFIEHNNQIRISNIFLIFSVLLMPYNNKFVVIRVNSSF